jgi:poly(3-hydroxybutyrate) depolymerase
MCEGPETPSTLSEKHASSCKSGVAVQFYKLQGGRHAWYAVPMNVAGSAPYNPLFDSTVGITTNDILWNFFAAHPKA